MPYYVQPPVNEKNSIAPNWCGGGNWNETYNITNPIVAPNDFYNVFSIVSAHRHLYIGGGLVLLVVFEYFTFAYFPLEKALVVEKN